MKLALLSITICAAMIILIPYSLYSKIKISFTSFNNIQQRQQCVSNHTYPIGYYRHFYNHNATNYSFYVFGIKVGEIFANTSHLNQTEISRYSKLIKHDLLYNPTQPNTNSKGSKLRSKQYHRMFDAFHNTKWCSSLDTTKNTKDSFFDFVQIGNDNTNNTIPPMEIYNLLPKEETFIDDSSGYDKYYLSQVNTYTISVDQNGSLPSLELRWGEIVNPIQQNSNMRHLVLNNNVKQLLWAGEMYYIYDYKFKRYVLIIDNASGTWKPHQKKLPKYLTDIFTRALFPNTLLVDGYKPVLFVDRNKHPWKMLKKRMFEVLTDIHLYHNEKHIDKLSFKKHYLIKIYYGKQIVAAKIPKKKTHWKDKLNKQVKSHFKINKNETFCIYYFTPNNSDQNSIQMLKNVANLKDVYKDYKVDTDVSLKFFVSINGTICYNSTVIK